MKKILSILFIVCALAFVSCNTKRGVEKDYQNVKELVDKSVDKTVDQTKEGMENVKGSWNEARDATDKKADTIKTDIRRDVKIKLH